MPGVHVDPVLGYSGSNRLRDEAGPEGMSGVVLGVETDPLCVLLPRLACCFKNLDTYWAVMLVPPIDSPR